MLFWRAVCAGFCIYLTLPVWATSSANDGERAPLSVDSRSASLRPGPQLREFIAQVWSESPAVQAAQAALDAARARAEGASRPLHNPTLELEAERTDIDTQTIGLTQTIDWSDKRGAFKRVADQDVHMARARLSQVREEIAAETLATLAHYFTAREMHALALRGSQVMSEFVEAARRRQAAGDMEALDLTLAQVAYSDALMAQAVSESELAEAEAAVQAVTGMSSGPFPELPSELGAPPETIDSSWIDRLPELVILRSNVDAATARTAVAEREGRIDPTVGLRVGREDSETLVGLSLEIPLFVRNNYSDQVRAASHDFIVEESGYRDAYRRAHARLAGATGRFKNVSRAWRAWLATGRRAHQEQRTLLEQMWRAGELTATDFLVQAKQNIDTQAAATALKGQVWEAAVAWLSAAGQIEQWLGIASPADETKFGESQ